MILVDLLTIIFLFSLFAVSHTWLASIKLKENLTARIGNRIAFYRLFYNISSIVIFSAFYALAPKPDAVVYDLRFPFDMITFALQVLSLAGFIWASQSISFREFSGIAQIERYMHGEYIIEELDEKQELKLDGAFKYSRHPIYFFSILFLGLRPTMNLFYLTFFLCAVVYFYAGTFYEEKKLVRMFGDRYADYQKSVPRMVPFIGKLNFFKRSSR